MLDDTGDMARILDTLVAISSQVYDLPDIPNPLAAINRIIDTERHTPRSRALSQILRGLTTDKGEFSESDIYALDLEALILVAALAQDVLNGRYERAQDSKVRASPRSS